MTAAERRGVDCVVGEWAPWGDCEGPCGESAFQLREREVRTPASGGKGARPCPALEESRPCSTAPCPASKLDNFMKTCGLADPKEAAHQAREELGASNVEDLFELDGEDLGEIGLKVSGFYSRSKMIDVNSHMSKFLFSG